MKYFVKFFVVTFLLLICTYASAEQKIVYLDMKFILNGSKAGKGAQDFLKNSLKENEKKSSKVINDLKKKEGDLLEKKTTLNKEEYKKQLDELRKKVMEFQTQRRAFIEQITKQLNKLVDVIRLVDLNEGRAIERELMLIKLRAAGGEQREEMKRLIDIFDGCVVDVTESTYTAEITGDGDKLDAFIEAVSPKRILEVVRSGALGILCGAKALRA